MANKIEIVAEIGINHGGDIKKALRLVDASVKAGADVIKFQTVRADDVYVKADPLYKIFKETEFSEYFWGVIKEYVEDQGKEFLSTPGDPTSADMLDKLGMRRFKIASDSAKHVKFVNYVAKKRKPMIISTGVMKDNEVVDYVANKYNFNPQYILHCVSKYPVPYQEARLERITIFQKKIIGKYIQIGYSDHVQGYDASLFAVGLGASMIEKHIKIDDNCVDAAVSLDAKDFAVMVRKIREFETML